MSCETLNLPGDPITRKRVAFYGGSFDPVHRGHLAIGLALLEKFSLDRFVFVPAFHAPHKKRQSPTSAYDRYAMLCLLTADLPNICVSRTEIEMPERPYSVDTLSRLRSEMPNDDIFFVMGADSWADITSWKDWDKVLSLTNHIVVTRPGYEIDIRHVTDEVRSRIVDLRGHSSGLAPIAGGNTDGPQIFLTDVVNVGVSATEIRQKIRERVGSRYKDVPLAVANFIEKYQIYN